MHYPLKRHSGDLLAVGNHSKSGGGNLRSGNGGLACLAAVVLFVTLLALMLYLITTKLNTDNMLNEEMEYDNQDDQQ